MSARRFAIGLLFLALACSGPSSLHNGSTGGRTSGTTGGSTGSSGGSSGGTTGGTTGDSSPPHVNNVAPLIVNQGLPGSGSSDIPFVSVTICVPNTSTCQTIDDMVVDTGSSGVRVMSQVIPFSLPQQNASNGQPLVECSQFGSGYTWGSVRLADVKLAGEVASGIPIQLVGDPAFKSIPGACSSSGPGLDSVAQLGAHGLIGINQIVSDCGPACAPPSNAPGAYYACGGGGCSVTGVSVGSQISNPIAFFASDRNGAVLEFPPVPAGGAVQLAGKLIFGIGTASNNGLGSAHVQTLDSYGNLPTIFNGRTLSQSFIDSGSNSLSFNDSAIATCPGQLSFLFCPSAPLNLSAEIRGTNGVTTNISFSVESAETLFSNDNGNYTAFDDIAGPGFGGSFDWGLPFFFGRSVYVGLEGASTPGGTGPFVAY